jgi:hypothetical protein
MSGSRVINLEAAAPEQPLLDELRAIGVLLPSIWETRHIKKMPAQALRMILHHLRADYPRKEREGMARALARREARDVVWQDVVALYRQEHDEPGGRVQEGLGSAIHVMARRDDLDTLIELIRDPKNGSSRVFFVRNLARTNSPKAFEVLSDLRHDPDLRVEIGLVLKRRKAKILVSAKTHH